jgi:hypothetical protein
MYTTTFYAMKSSIDSKADDKTFINIWPSLVQVKMSGNHPYYKIVLRECDESETPKYFGWKDFVQERYNFIYNSKILVQICFPYGIKAAEKRGLGKLVGFILDNYEELT